MSAPRSVERLARLARARPRTPAIVGADETLATADWWERSGRVAAALSAAGTPPGGAVALVGGIATYAELAVGYVGCLRAGVPVLPLDAERAPGELRRTLARAGVERVLHCGERAPRGIAAWRRVAVLAHTGADAGAPVAPVPDPGDLAELLATSGTTGEPAIVRRTHALLAADYALEPRTDPAPWHFVHSLAPGSSIGQVALRMAISLGYTVVAIAPRDVGRVLAALAELPGRELLCVPAMAAALVAEAEAQKRVLPDCEIVALSGAAAPPALWRRLAAVFPAAKLVNTYTTTEAWPAHVRTLVDADADGSVGRPDPPESVALRTPGGAAVAPGERGEIWLRSHAAAGAGWVRTGDAGRLDADGRLFVEDRLDDLVLVGGRLVSSVALEAALHELDDVAEAAVVAHPHPTLGHRLVAYVALARGAVRERAEAALRERLAERELPAELALVAELPRGATGKVLKRRLRERAAGAATCADAVEARVHAIWADVLEREPIDPRSSFVAAGGDSLAAMRVLARVQAAWPGIAARELLARTTIRAQAQLVRERAGAPAAGATR